MVEIKRRLALPEDRFATPLEIGRLIALVDSLCIGALNAVQSEAVRQLRAGIAALAERENTPQVVNVLFPEEISRTGESSLPEKAL